MGNNLTNRPVIESRVESSPDICMRRRTRCSVTTAPDDGSRMLEKLSLQQALEGAQRQFGLRGLVARDVDCSRLRGRTPRSSAGQW